MVVDLESGVERQLTDDKSDIFGLDWLPRSGGLPFSTNRGKGIGLWVVDPEHLALERVISTAEGPIDLAVAETGARMAYVQPEMDTNMWRVRVDDLTGADSPRFDFEQLTQFPRWDSKPRASPTGAIVFDSNRTGRHELWGLEPGGSPEQLTRLGGSYSGSARYAHRDQRLAFEGRPEGRSEIFMLDLETDASAS